MRELDDREPQLRVVTPRLTDEERRTAIYGGELLVYADIEARMLLAANSFYPCPRAVTGAEVEHHRGAA